jgi:hypothetical protein
MLRYLRNLCCPDPTPEIVETPYERLYPLDTPELFETPENREKGQVEEMTPEGRVRMRLRDGIFEYWADRAHTYRYLETVARKYVIVYDCREQYVNMFRELLKAREAVAPPPAPVHAVYATLKRNAPPPRASVVNAAANRYKWLGKAVETVAPRGMSYRDFKKQR